MNRRLVVLMFLFLLAAMGRWRVQAVEPASAASLGRLPLVLGEWTGRHGPAFDSATLAVLGADDYLNRIYRSPAGDAGVYVGYHRSQRTGDAIHSPLNCLPGAGWQPLAEERIGFDGKGFVRQVVVGKGEDQQLVLYWYQSAHHLEGDEYRSKLYLLLNAMRWRRNDAALVRIVVPIDTRREDGRAAAGRTAYALAILLEPEVRAVLFREDAGRES